MNSFSNNLSQISLFDDLEETELEPLSKVSVERKYKENSIIYFEGDLGDNIYFIKDGKIKISKTTEVGEEVILYVLGKGDFFGEIELFDEGNVPNTASAITDSNIILVRNTDMKGFLRISPEVTLRMLKLMSQRLRISQMKVKDMALQNASSRVIGTLVNLAQDHGKKDSKGIEIDLLLSRKDLANMAGLSRETLTRVLFKLQSQGLINLEGRGIIIRNMEELMKQF